MVFFSQQVIVVYSTIPWFCFAALHKFISNAHLVKEEIILKPDELHNMQCAQMG